MPLVNPTNAIADRCCDNCDTPRTKLQFQENHIRLLQGPLEEDATCAICQLPYGSEDLSALLLDNPCVIVSMPHCSHMFGQACLARMCWTAEQDTTTNCPLCRTTWWYNGCSSQTEQERRRVCEFWAKQYQCDYNTTRWSIYKEPEYAGLYLPLALEEAEDKDTLFHNLRLALQLPVFENTLEVLRDQCKITTIVEAAFDPQAIREQRFTHIDVFKFNNYHLDTYRMSMAMYLTLFSWRGTRLLELYRSNNKGVPCDEEGATTEAIVKSWMATFPDDEEKWVNLIVRALWVADAPDRPDDEETGESDRDAETNGNEEGVTAEDEEGDGEGPRL